MSKRLIIPICIFLWSALLNSLCAQTENDSVEYVRVCNWEVQLKKANSKKIQFNFKGIELKKLLSESEFTYSTQHPLTTRNGFLLGWHFKFNDRWKINVYFSKKKLKESDNVYLCDIKLDSVTDRRIRRIEVIKEIL